MAAAKVWGVAALMASAWPLASGAPWLSAMPLQWRWVWQLQLLSPWQWASALVLVFRLRSPRPKYRPGPNHKRYLVDLDRRTEMRRCGPPNY